jgi:hypothetical protein
VRPAPLLLLSALSALPAAAGGDGEDPRSRVLVREDCWSAIGRREVTFFANGTIRLREGSAERDDLTLAEVGREEAAAFERRLAEPDLTEIADEATAPEGAGVETCTLELRVSGRPPRTFRYGRYASHGLALRAVLAVVRDLEATAARNARTSDLPGNYEPRVGDFLARADGAVFEIEGFTSDGKGVELSSRDQPVVLYLPREELRRHFVRLVRRRAER